VVVTLASLNENFRPTDVEHHAGIMADVNDYTKSGELQGSKAKVAFDANGEMVKFNWNEDEAVSNFTRQVDSKINFDNVVGSKVKGLYEVETSFKASLEKNINISVGVLQNMFVDENNDGINDIEVLFNQLDRAGGKDGGDGVIDEKDLAAGEGIPGFERNLDAIIDALTNTDNPAFNMKTSAPMLGAFLAEAAKGRSELAFNTAAGSRKDKSDKILTEDHLYTMPDGQRLYKKQILVEIDKILTAPDGDAIFKRTGDGVFEKIGGEWWDTTYEEKTEMNEDKIPVVVKKKKKRKVSEDYVIRRQGYGVWGKGGAENNPITDYKKEGGKWYYIKGGQKKEVSAGNFERLEAQALIAEARAKK
jgi:hypothetical protein